MYYVNFLTEAFFEDVILPPYVGKGFRYMYMYPEHVSLQRIAKINFSFLRRLFISSDTKQAEF